MQIGTYTAFLLLLPAASLPCIAGSLQVSPVNLEVVTPGSATLIKARNQGTRPLTVQVRIFRWVQTGGTDKLEPAAEVVASPPMAKLQPASDYTIRIVRIAKAPVRAEESYRLVVDEIPEQSALQSGTVNLLLRHSIPVFFRPAAAGAPRITWLVEHRRGGSYLTATNHGDRRLRLAMVNIKDRSGTIVSFGAGLTGYILSGSSMSWPFPDKAPSLSTKGEFELSAMTDLGLLSVSIPQHGR
jgi:fimbrial chaperone protein